MNMRLLTASTAPAAQSVVASTAASRQLTIALVCSLLFHAVLLNVQFTMPEPSRADNRERSLEVILVNARHERPAQEADVLAQAHLDGGGSTDENVRPTTPVPPKDVTREGDALLDATKRTEAAAIPDTPVMTSPRPEPVKVTRPEQARQADQPVEQARPSGTDLLDAASIAAQIEAQIDRSLNEYAKRPRKQFIGARAREYRFARYVDDWRLKIERVGTLNYPEAARGRLYGDLLITVAIRADGSLERVEIERSSGQKILDEAALQIVRLAAPFASFPPDIRADTDIIEITRTWRFTNADRLLAQ